MLLLNRLPRCGTTGSRQHSEMLGRAQAPQTGHAALPGRAMTPRSTRCSGSSRRQQAAAAQQHPRSPQHASFVCAAAAVDAPADAPAAPSAPLPKPTLSELPLQAIINPQGFVDPAVVPGTAASVFAVYDEQQKLQYIGFSRELRSSLRMVLGRRPEKAFYFKACQLPALDQDHMLAVRQAWFDECGAPPPGNKLALERKAWQSAVDAGAISARAKPAAAADKAKELQAALKARGCVEEFSPDPELLQDGQVDFLQQTSDQAEQQQVAASAAAAASGSSRPVRTATAVVDGQAKQFSIEYQSKFPTRGGFMVDVKLSFDHMDTKHRIIVGSAYYEPYGLQVEAPIEAALALLLHKKMTRHTEGMLGSSEFPVNYFTIAEMEQWFGEEFAASFLHISGKQMDDGSDFFWRMNKIHEYGGKLEDPRNLGAALAQSGLGSYGGQPAS